MHFGWTPGDVDAMRVDDFWGFCDALDKVNRQQEAEQRRAQKGARRGRR